MLSVFIYSRIAVKFITPRNPREDFRISFDCFKSQIVFKIGILSIPTLASKGARILTHLRQEIVNHLSFSGQFLRITWKFSRIFVRSSGPKPQC